MNCKNCLTSLNESDFFCSNCGGKIIRNRLTIRNLFKNFSEQFLNYDNKFLQTFIHLFSKPETVIGSYIDGTRKKYVNVLSYFAIALTFLGVQYFFLKKFYPELIDMTTLANETSAAIQKKNMNFMMEYQSFVMMAYVPMYALVSRLVFFNIKKYNYTEHLVIFMYILSQTSIYGTFFIVIGAFFNLSLEFLGLYLIAPIQIIYSAYCLKRLFGLSLKGIFLRSLLFILIIFIAFILLLITYIAIIYFTGDLQEMIEAQKAANKATGN